MQETLLKILNFKQIKMLSYFLFFLGIFFGGRYAVNGIALFILISLIGFFIYGTNRIVHFNRYLLIPVFFYILHIISSFYSEHHKETIFDLEVKLSFIILPLIFGFEKIDLKINKHKILMVFAETALFSGLFLIIKGLYAFYITGVFPRYTDFSPFVHASYLTAYFTFNIIVICFLYKNHQNIFRKIILISSLLISLSVIYFAESKAGFIILIFVFIILVFRRLHKISKFWTYNIIILSLLIFANVLIKNQRFMSMIQGYDTFKDVVNGKQKYIESTAERLMTWDASIKLIKEHPWAGYGNGDTRDKLTEKYKELGYEKPAKLRLNAHNQYLETFLSLGIVGFISLLALLFIPAFFLKGDMSFLFRMFIYIFSLNFLFESMFNTQAGVIFFFFFYSFLISYNENRFLPPIDSSEDMP
jgi:O-antigen ligase